MSKASMEVYMDGNLQRICGDNTTSIPYRFVDALKDILTDSDWCKEANKFEFIFKLKRRKKSSHRMTVVLDKLRTESDVETINISTDITSHNSLVTNITRTLNLLQFNSDLLLAQIGVVTDDKPI